MSSSMLEQAVIDAQALKEAAMKNAEQEVLEKYSGEIKEAVDTLLEQEADPMAVADPMAAADPLAADPMAGGDPMAAAGVAGGNADEIAAELPLKALDETKFAEDNEEVELDLDALKEALEPVIYETSQSQLEGLLEEGTVTNSEEIVEEVTEEIDEELDEEIEIDEETLKNTIEEILKVDLENVPRGDMGTTHPTRPQQVYGVDVALAAEQDSAIKEQTEEWQAALAKIMKLEEHVKSLKSQKNRLVKEHKELQSVARQVSNKLAELNTTNAKLVYQNRILESHSLNERQKQKLVEAVSNANSTEEAKVIYETLQDSLSSKVQNGPKNLNEAISKNSRLVLKSNKKETQVSDSASERMKRLAGII